MYWRPNPALRPGRLAQGIKINYESAFEQERACQAELVSVSPATHLNRHVEFKQLPASPTASHTHALRPSPGISLRAEQGNSPC